MLMVNIKRPFKDEYICKTSHFSSTSLFFSVSNLAGKKITGIIGYIFFRLVFLTK